MFKPEIDPNDISDIETLISDLFIRQPRNPDGSMKPQTVFGPHESKMLVATVLNELGSRGYAIMKPKPEGRF